MNNAVTRKMRAETRVAKACHVRVRPCHQCPARVNDAPASPHLCNERLLLWQVINAVLTASYSTGIPYRFVLRPRRVLLVCGMEEIYRHDSRRALNPGAAGLAVAVSVSAAQLIFRHARVTQELSYMSMPDPSPTPLASPVQTEIIHSPAELARKQLHRPVRNLILAS
ncbi:hypothetical protein JZ751_008533 [Albula glossodonta]|uniref:Uncharacterized protein n=1 Tax=Albula glossodonta TaxID=121402 RepID=A0A8T2N269_9TELE|nr:hypothetical protein JZ751_008533 [Albula glossodonta]